MPDLIDVCRLIVTSRAEPRGEESDYKPRPDLFKLS